MLRRYLRIGQSKLTRGIPKATVVARREGNFCVFGWSICSPKDGFMYKKARAIADERLAERKFRVPIQPGYNRLNIQKYFEMAVPDYHHKDRVTQIFDFIAETLTDLVTYGDKNDLPVVPTRTSRLMGKGLDR